MPCRGLQKTLIGQPGRGARVGLQALLCGPGAKVLAQCVAHHGVHAAPHAAFGADENRRFQAELRQPVGSFRVGGHDAAQIGMQVIQDGQPHQKIPVFLRQVGQQQRDQLPLQTAAQQGHARHARAGIATAQHNAQRQLQPQCPALCQGMQAGRDAAVKTCTGTRLHQLQGFVQVKAHQCRVDDRALAVGNQVIQLDAPVGPRRNHGAQVGGGLPQQVEQRVARLGRQLFGLIDDQDHVQG